MGSESSSSEVIARLPAPSVGEMITVLSIDGGGVRGIIPSVMLAYLEEELQRLDGPNARIAHYFDVVAGTSTGGILTTMLCAPHQNENGAPLFTAKDTTQFYLQNCPLIFPPKSGCLLGALQTCAEFFAGPKYSGEQLHALLKTLLRNTALHQTLTNIVIPTYDIMLEQPFIFNTFQARRDKLKDPLLSDVCIATSAAPTYLPAHSFQLKDEENGRTRIFNLIDGAFAETNPTLLAINEIVREAMDSNGSFVPHDRAKDKSKFLVLSLGTGKKTKGYTARQAQKWGLLGWLTGYSGLGSIGDKIETPLLDMFTESGLDMTDVFAAVVFKEFDSMDKYLRIQTQHMPGNTGSTDDSSQSNLQHLLKLANALLHSSVTRVDLDTGELVPVPCVGTNTNTNKEALSRFALALSAERKLRLSRQASSSSSSPSTNTTTTV